MLDQLVAPTRFAPGGEATAYSTRHVGDGIGLRGASSTYLLLRLARVYRRAPRAANGRSPGTVRVATMPACWRQSRLTATSFGPQLSSAGADHSPDLVLDG